MLLASTLDLDEAIRRLSSVRPVFHSEDDLKRAFARELRSLAPAMDVQLESPAPPRGRRDMLLVSSDGSSSTAIELKYPTARWSGEAAGDVFDLKEQGAQDERGYDVVKDLVRVEDSSPPRPAATALSSA